MTQPAAGRPLMKFDSHVAGKNAMVTVWPDRIEWEKKGVMGTGAKVGLGVATLGASFLATGVRGKQAQEMILMRSITSVTNKRSGLNKEIVSVVTPGGVIDFRCSSAEAAQLKQTILANI